MLDIGLKGRVKKPAPDFVLISSAARAPPSPHNPPMGITYFKNY